MRTVRIALRLDSVECRVQLQPGTIEQTIRFFQQRYVLCRKTGTLESNDVYTDRPHVEARIHKERRHIKVYTCVAADHCESANLRVLVDNHTARDECLILHIDVAGNQRATGYHGTVADTTVMSDVPGCHDVVLISELGHRLRLCPSRNRIVFANFVAAPDLQVASLAGEYFVERIRSKHRAC